MLELSHGNSDISHGMALSDRRRRDVPISDSSISDCRADRPPGIDRKSAMRSTAENREIQAEKDKTIQHRANKIGKTDTNAQAGIAHE